MELNAIPYQQLHDIVVEVMKERGKFVKEHERSFSVIGKWYHEWLLSYNGELTLRIPFYSKGMVSSLIEYQYWLDLLIQLFDAQPAKDMTGYVLFDIRGYKAADRYYRKNNNFAIEYRGSRSKIHHFDTDIQVAADRFLPLFRSDQIFGNNELLGDLFCLLSALGMSNLIPYSITLDLEKDQTLFLKQTSQDKQERAFSKTLSTDDFRNDNEKRDMVLDDLIDTDLKRCIVLTYPYHVDVSSTVINEFRERAKIFRIELSSRFNHEMVNDNELVLTRSEIGIGNGNDIIDVLEQFHIIETNCSPMLIAALQALKYDWTNSRFNMFTTPFPVKWLLCVHHGHDIDFWRERFKKDYPELSGKLLADSLHIIGLVFELNWIGHYLAIKEDGTLLLPRSTMHSEVILSLKEHLSSNFDHIGFSDDIDSALIEGGDIYLLDPFNVTLFNNITLPETSWSFQIIAPDFLYYTYQPFVRYLALKYCADAFTGGARAMIDGSYMQHAQKWSTLTEQMRQESRKALYQFNNLKSIKIVDEKIEDQLELLSEPTPSELLERIASKELKIYERNLSLNIEINTSSKKKLSLRPNTPVLIKENGCLIRTIAAVLENGALFIPLDEVIKSMDLRKMIDRLVTLSDAAKQWHQRLRELVLTEDGVYLSLKNAGLSVSTGTFEKDYLSGNESTAELHMPRAKNDWKLICERLHINDRQIAWNAVKCREDLNQLRSVYLKILELMLDTGSFGINVSDTVLDQVTRMLAVLPDAELNAKETKKDAIALIIEICDKISLEKIEHIDNLNLST